MSIQKLNDCEMQHNAEVGLFTKLSYLMPERKLGFFVKIKEDENFNHRNTGSISRIKI